MRRLSLVVATLAVLGIAAPAHAATIVTIKRSGFSPTLVTIPFGGTVTWRNADTVNHQVVSDTGAFASPILRPGARYSHTFNAAGRYRYHDALKPTLRGTVIVKGPPPSVTLAASTPIVVWGTPITLSGAISNKKAGETVTLFGQPYGAAFVQLAVVLTATGGTFTYQLAPDILTAYVARWGTTQSAPVSVQVKPKVTFRPCGRRFCTTVTADAHSFAGRFVYLQRLSIFGQWVSVAKLKLGPRSGRIFDIPRRHGTTVYRIFLTVNQAGAGFLDSHSGTQKVRRR